MNKGDFYYNGPEYNENLYKYFYETEDYVSEDDYYEIFFQDYIEGNISKNEYFEHENSVLESMNVLYKNSKTFAYYSPEVNLENSFLYRKSNDIFINLNVINKNKGKVFSVNDKDLFKQLCLLTLREIESVIFIFPEIKAIALNSGLHGLLLFENPIDINLEKNLSGFIKLNKD